MTGMKKYIQILALINGYRCCAMCVNHSNSAVDTTGANMPIFVRSLNQKWKSCAQLCDLQGISPSAGTQAHRENTDVHVQLTYDKKIAQSIQSTHCARYFYCGLWCYIHNVTCSGFLLFMMLQKNHHNISYSLEALKTFRQINKHSSQSTLFTVYLTRPRDCRNVQIGMDTVCLTLT